MADALPSDEPEPEPFTVASDGLATRVSRGLGWSLGGQVLGRLLIFGSGVVLARLLNPADFGEVATGLVVTSIVLAINELGVIPAIVRASDPVDADAATGATIAFVNSCLMYVVAVLIAPYVADVANTPGSVVVIRIMALSVVVDGVIAVPLAMLSRELRTVPQVAAEFAGMTVYAATAIGLASTGLGATALAWGRVAGAVSTGVLIAAAGGWPTRPEFDLEVARRLVSFGLPLAASSALLEAVLNVDYLVVGSQLATVALGVYLLAFNLSSWPVSVLSVAIARVSFAGYSALRHDPERLDRSFAHSVAVALSCTVPLVAILGAVAADLVELVYGRRWEAAVAPLRWLVIVGGIRVLLAMAGEVIAVVGHVRAVFWIRMVWLLLLPPALAYGARRDGLRGVGIAHVVVAAGVITPLFLWQLRVAGLSLRRLADAAVRPTLAGVAGVVSMRLAAPLIGGVLLRLIVVAAIGGTVYSALILPANPLVGTLWRQLRGRPATSLGSP